MGSKVSTARTLGKLPIKTTLERSTVNQLPPKQLKERFNGQQNTNPVENQTQPDDNVMDNNHNLIGKDGHDPDFINVLNHLGRSMKAVDSNEINNSEAVNQLKNREKIYQANKEREDLIDPKKLSTILSDLKRYDEQTILRENNITWGNVLRHFKVADTYKEFKETKKGEVGHEGVRNSRTLQDSDFKQGRQSDMINQSEDGGIRDDINEELHKDGKNLKNRISIE
ncbi:hypothetical protein CLIB1444_14S01904 [[Candida] jaroonii]|uniref:Uncharacterized protein n=1 Tax=[Candida] jaroonii TaxID=467808 RepID=A0ACA9YE25_9ASCO|nr:hypothetical protein CLIB1444_14S01904 [[Candida] jaroonii]